MHVCVLDATGKVLVHRNIPASRDDFLSAVAAYRRHGLVVAAECMFAWYWLADLCAEYKVPFVLGHALYMKAIHGGKTKTRQDRFPEDRHAVAGWHAADGVRLCRVKINRSGTSQRPT